MVEFDIGFLGGGQLARMSIQAAQRMGLKCFSLDPAENSPASQIAASITGQLNDPDKISEVIKKSLVVTLENEFIPASSIREAFSKSGENEAKLVPGIDTLATIQDKLLQRLALINAGVPCPHAVAIDDGGERAKSEIGFPMVLKARFGGYDGKGTRYAKSEEDFESHRELWEGGGWLAENFVPFKRELAVMVYFSPSSRGSFPTMETIQTNHVCDLVFPSGVDASDIAIAAIEAVKGKGLFGVELFELEDGSFQVNEIAPRPHNTGHYTLDWGGTSQFEQHVRLVCGLPVFKPFGFPTCMANLLGQEDAGDYRLALAPALGTPGVHFHWYGKQEAKIGRKMGHVNVVGREGDSAESLVSRATQARKQFYLAWVTSH